MADSSDGGCGCLLLILAIFLAVSLGGLTLSCGGCYLGPIPKEGK